MATKKRKKRLRITRCLMVLLVVLMVCGIGVGVFKKQEPISQPEDPVSPSADSSFRIAEDVKLDTDCIEISTLGDLMKIDIVTPSLDTCSLRVAIYDLKTNQALSETSFDESSWNGGLTKNGYYMMDHLKNKLYLYSPEGEKRLEKQFPSSNDWIPISALSEDETYFVYMTYDQVLHIYNLKNDKEQTVESPYQANTLYFDQGLLYMTSIYDQMDAVDPEKCEYKVLEPEERQRCLNPSYGLETEIYFIVNWQQDWTYIPMTNVDETLIGTSKDSFATITWGPEYQVIRNYNVAKAKMQEIRIEDEIEKVYYIDNHRMIVLAGSPAAKRHQILLYDLDEIESMDISVNSEMEDNQTSSPEIEIPEAEPALGAHMVENVPVISQYPDYPTGCESVSAIMALHYAGEMISLDDFIDQYLPKSMDFYVEDGKNYGPSPYEYFIGSPYSEASYGCMATVMEGALENCLSENNTVVNTTGKDLDALCEEYIDNNIPVMVWATINMLETSPVNSWYLSNGQRFTWPGNEHCLVLVGYDEEQYYFNDPYAGRMVSYTRQLCNDRHAELGSQSLVIVPKQ